MRLLGISQYRIQLAHSVRVTSAALLALIAAWLLDLRLPLWAVLTAVILTQLSVGRSLKATGDYLVGTLGGAVYGGAIAVAIPHSSAPAVLGVLALTVAPTAAIAALRPNLQVVPVTAIIVLLVPTITHASPLESAIDRVLEVAVGAVAGLLVSFLILPSSAHRMMRQTAARTLGLMAETLSALLAGLAHGLDFETLHRLQDGIGQSLVELDGIAAEAERERRSRLSHEAETGPLRRTLVRLRHDLVMVGRASTMPLPANLQPRLAPRLAAVADAASAYLRANGAALSARHGPASLDSFEGALTAYDREVDAVRSEGLTRVLDGDAAERFFAVGFALEQLHQNLGDLRRVVQEWAD
jgi:uncharacterized membrane protein YccC